MASLIVLVGCLVMIATGVVSGPRGPPPGPEGLRQKRSVAGTSVLSITADDQLVELYVDGVATSFAPGGWGTVRVINIPSNFEVIAVKAVDLQGVVSGILASVDCNRLVTGSSWKCTTLNINNWYTASFDDRSWPAAVIAGTNTASDIHHNLPQIDSSARWIWTRNHQAPTIDPTVYCRGHAGETTDNILQWWKAKIDSSIARRRCLLWVLGSSAASKLQHYAISNFSHRPRINTINSLHYGESTQKSEWPELVGMTGEAAKEVILTERPQLHVYIILMGSVVTEDWRLDRVRVWVDVGGVVVSPPRIG